jgi:hypothetical protein
LPYSKRKYYLSGSDWLMGVLDAHLRRTSGTGSHSTLVIELSDKLPPSRLAERLERIYGAVPELAGRIRRDLLNLAPYWAPARNSQPPPVASHETGDEQALHDVLAARLNEPLSGKDQHLAFTVLHGAAGNRLLLTFDHRLLDARGAETFLELLGERPPDGLTAALARIKRTDSPHLCDWQEQFAAGREVQRRLIALSLQESQGFVPPFRAAAPDQPQRKLRFSHRPFSPEAGTALAEQAERAGAGLLEMPFLLALTLTALHRAAGAASARYLVPVPVDLRPRGRERERMLFNHLAFLFFGCEMHAADTPAMVLPRILAEYFDQVAGDFPAKFADALRPARIFPVGLLQPLLALPAQGRLASLAFAHVGDGGTAAADILGVPIQRVWHLPRIPTPPGLGVFFSRWRGELHLTQVWDETVDLQVAERLSTGIISSLH